eukprot:scaffold33221_cov55-Phaeocystis_antarctica.AAC.4
MVVDAGRDGLRPSTFSGDRKIPQARGCTPNRWSSIWSPWSPVRPASRALLREADACSGPLDGRTHCRQFDRTRGTRYQIAAVAAGKRLPKWLTHIVWLAGRRSLRRPPGVLCDRGGLSHSADPHPTHNNVCLLVHWSINGTVNGPFFSDWVAGK